MSIRRVVTPVYWSLSLMNLQWNLHELFAVIVQAEVCVEIPVKVMIVALFCSRIWRKPMVAATLPMATSYIWISPQAQRIQARRQGSWSNLFLAVSLHNEQKRPGAVSDQVYIPKCMIEELNAVLGRQFQSKYEIQRVAGQKGQAKMPNPITYT